ncbi:hypothetical protein BN946_scf184847.g19 [Trametes cinnabarina]|uniref:Uncharacterized protein n=1 Tax=Pycnoporus cinnabarinus TaxID=5643 RepID=A0A060SKH8_PYCCI|nr:hypothetical protein BN946_scf184847.g19 [Trametes cinnabarina]
MIHLVFTAQYHWPLAPVNFVLQMSAATTLLIACIATMHVVLSSTIDQSLRWPYMLDYIAIEIPPLQDNTAWQMGELAAWLLMNAATSGLIQITHIQFLTLLFPSGLERRLIFCLLGPLAIISSTMQILRIHDNAKLVKIAFAVQNVCNATLSLLFTASLFLWGCFVNRRDAWRTDGGTAAFGIGALTLALLSTALTFLYIPSREQYPWMPGFMWAVILWQSFLGWWWWVGAGMGVGEIEELLRREEKRQEKRRAKMARRKMRKERAQTIWKGMTGALGYSGREGVGAQDDEPSDSGHSGAETEARDGEGADVSSGTSNRSRRIRRVPTHQTEASGTSVSGGPVSRFLRQYTAGRVLYNWYLGLRHAHIAAAHAQAVERVERINQAYGAEAEASDGGPSPLGRPAVFGWGLGSFWMRKQQQRRRREAHEAEDARMAYKMDVLGGAGVPVASDHGSDVGSVRSGAEACSTTTVRHRQDDGSASGPRRATHRAAADAYPLAQDPAEDAHRPSSMWWWGPLQRWRLQDSTDYQS